MSWDDVIESARQYEHLAAIEVTCLQRDDPPTFKGAQAQNCRDFTREELRRHGLEHVQVCGGIAYHGSLEDTDFRGLRFLLPVSSIDEHILTVALQQALDGPHIFAADESRVDQLLTLGEHKDVELRKLVYGSRKDWNEMHPRRMAMRNRYFGANWDTYRSQTAHLRGLVFELYVGELITQLLGDVPHEKYHRLPIGQYDGDWECDIDLLFACDAKQFHKALRVHNGYAGFKPQQSGRMKKRKIDAIREKESRDEISTYLTGSSRIQ